MATASITRRFASGTLGASGEARLRLGADGRPYVTDNGQYILDVHGLAIPDPLGFESEINNWPGVVTVGIFAHQRASVCLVGTPEGVTTVGFD